MVDFELPLLQSLLQQGALEPTGDFSWFMATTSAC
jgi:hypothetical protein